MIHIPVIHTLHYQSKREFWHQLEYGHAYGSPSWPTSGHFSQTFMAKARSFPFPSPLCCAGNILTQQIFLFAVSWRQSQCTLLRTMPPRDVFSPLGSCCFSLAQPREIKWGSHVSVTLACKTCQCAHASLILQKPYSSLWKVPLGVWAVQYKGLTCSLPVFWQVAPEEKKLLLECLSDPSPGFSFHALRI